MKIPTDWLDSDEVEDLGSDAVMLMISALGYAARQTSNGVVPRRRLRKLWPVDDLDQAVERLTEAGELEDQGDDVLFVRWRDFILAEDEVEAIREASRVRTERSRRHRKGDHTMCRADYCGAAKRHESRNGDATAHVSDGHPTRPDPTRPLGRGEGEGAQAGSAGATPPGPREESPRVHEFAPRPGLELDEFDLPPAEALCATCHWPYNALTHHAHDYTDDPTSPGTCTDCAMPYEWPGHAYWFAHGFEDHR
ncbi:MAG: hypothetical protein OSB43_04645 [Nocardioides sp.]|uniref:hypothetical protein n=1 Tax=Nocardioides sp. TaxID=35761 RepID=UPI002381D94A|nr:hypothetical protein [Nocardioides sp.]MDE0775547.1 hypothetical protein [Nocardioides sp.]